MASTSTIFATEIGLVTLTHFKPNSILAAQSPTHAGCKDLAHRTMITVYNVNEYAQKAAYGSMLSLMPHKSSDIIPDISDPQGRAAARQAATLAKYPQVPHQNRPNTLPRPEMALAAVPNRSPTPSWIA